MLAMTDPKLPAPITPTGLSDELFKVIPDEAIVIVVEHVQILRHNIPLLVSEQRPLEVEYSHVVEAAPDDDVRITFKMRGVVEFSFFFQVVYFFSYFFKRGLELIVWNLKVFFRQPQKSEQVE